ncbi:nitroreductase [Longilinea arvoryzae]|uniref:Nitroreductase n=1 Tax=Longilinea arvoryzae TaxID=360412 RepID=A0A0S7BDR0_9CHLR|nr:nitroreductase family protein [Longilinea arvoryzae]GAP13513.1 nitroreductase [Longilinea arvoryzae]
MNETLNVIHNRRSIRSYTPEPITDDELHEIIQAGIYAPSARNSQDWHFSVVRDAAVLGKLKEIMKENMLNSGVEFLTKRASEPGFVAFFDAPMLILLSADEKERFAAIDCGAAAENIALAAESLHIGTCLMTSSELLFARDADGKLKKSLGIPDGYRHVCALTVGHKDGEQPAPAPRKENLVNTI